MAIHIEELVIILQTKRGKLTLKCDNLSAISTFSNKTYTINPDIMNFNIKIAITSLIQNGDIEYEFKWIEGHQDKLDLCWKLP